MRSVSAYVLSVGSLARARALQAHNGSHILHHVCGNIGCLAQFRFFGRCPRVRRAAQSFTSRKTMSQYPFLFNCASLPPHSIRNWILRQFSTLLDWFPLQPHKNQRITSHFFCPLATWPPASAAKIPPSKSGSWTAARRPAAAAAAPSSPSSSATSTRSAALRSRRPASTWCRLVHSTTWSSMCSTGS